MTLRKVPGALALGLLASLGAHAALFGDSHAMGGVYHALLMQGVLLAATGIAVCFGALAWSSVKTAADGSVVASRLRARLPSAAAVALAAGFWYSLAEAIEPHHAAPSPLFAVVLLVFAAWLVLRVASAFARAIGLAVLAVSHTPFAPRTPRWARRPQHRPLARRTFFAHRRFARPPPIIAATRA